MLYWYQTCITADILPEFPLVLKSPDFADWKIMTWKVLNLDIGPEKVLKEWWQRCWKISQASVLIVVL